ncbi:MAG: thioredoxin family protein [Nanoarchaeota archaeon]|nr:thioredoxin family protein [Nanoarchaeota archaeon]MBU0976918.1 thioredoxin family protein [Nanoarchaeota archaeon]
MRKKLFSVLTGIMLSALAKAQQPAQPTWYNRPETSRDVVTRQVGITDEKTQGVVTIYGADWCGFCDNLEKQIEETHLDEKLAEEGIVFRYIRNQNADGDKSKPRVNEHIKKGSSWSRENLRGIPCIFIDDLGRSFKGDKAELAAQHLRKFKGLEEYIERYALDRPVSLLTEEEKIKVLEGIGSGLYTVEYAPLYNDDRTGFRFTPKNRGDLTTRESIRRLHLVENAVFLWDSQIVGEYNPPSINKPRYLPTDEQLSQIKVSNGYEKDFDIEINSLKEKIAQSSSWSAASREVK